MLSTLCSGLFQARCGRGQVKSAVMPVAPLFLFPLLLDGWSRGRWAALHPIRSGRQLINLRTLQTASNLVPFVRTEAPTIVGGDRP